MLYLPLYLTTLVVCSMVFEGLELVDPSKQM